jgi:two-component system, response regulator
MTDKKRTILLVEDNSGDEELAREAFADCGITEQVVVARDGVEAIDYLLGEPGGSRAPKAPLPVLVLLDLRLPRLDGLDVLRQLRAEPRTKRLPVVVLTTSTEDRDVAAAYELGCSGYVQKPMAMDEFVAAVRAIKAFFLDLIVPPVGHP